MFHSVPPVPQKNGTLETLKLTSAKISSNVGSFAFWCKHLVFGNVLIINNLIKKFKKSVNTCKHLV
jgi:hypothetical protein